jgi:hypothetical protein
MGCLGRLASSVTAPRPDPDCRRNLEEAEVRVLAFKAWKEEAMDRPSGQA